MVFFCLVSSKNDFCDYFLREKENVIPKDTRSDMNFDFTFDTFNINYNLPLEEIKKDFTEYVIRAVNPSSVDGAIFLMDNAYSNCHALIEEIKASLFFGFFHTGNYKKKPNYHNIVSGVSAALIKNFSKLSPFFDQNKFRTSILLPIKNFKSNKIIDLVHIANEKSTENKFIEYFSSKVREIRALRKVKSSTNSAEKFYVDDRGFFFVYGHEEHSLIETGVPPHNKLCGINGNYRFGRRIETNRHYNVSKENGHMSGSLFINCHGENVIINKSVDNVNIFSNDLCNF